MGAELPKKGCLLISSYSGNWNFGVEDISSSFSEYLTAAFDFWEHGARDIKKIEQFLIPLLGMDVENQRAAGIRDVGEVAFTSSELPD